MSAAAFKRELAIFRTEAESVGQFPYASLSIHKTTGDGFGPRWSPSPAPRFMPNGNVAEMTPMLKAIHAREDRKAGRPKATENITQVKAMTLKDAAELVEQPVRRRQHEAGTSGRPTSAPSRFL